MRVTLPAAALFAVLMTAGSGLAVIEAVNELALAGEAAAGLASQFAGESAAETQVLAATQNVSTFAYAELGHAIDAKTGVEAIAAGVAAMAAGEMDGGAEAVSGAVQDQSAFVAESVDATAAWADAVAADAGAKAEAVEALASYVGGQPYEAAIALAGDTAEPAQVLLSSVEYVVQDPAVAWALVRAEADDAYGLAMAQGDFAVAVADNIHQAAASVLALELAALAGADDVVEDCAGAERPLACAEEFAHSIIEA